MKEELEPENKPSVLSEAVVVCIASLAKQVKMCGSGCGRGGLMQRV